ncbi:MAG TPA: hypothetical protein VGE00_10990 [Gammaproteobacteria bacterium]
MSRYQQPQWSVELPEGWHGEREDESTLFRREGGAGTLAVTLLCEEESVTRETLLELAASTLEEGHLPSAIQAGELQGLFFSYEEEGTAWREWYLAAGRCLFFVSYDCATGEAASEAAAVNAIIARLELSD